MTEQTHLFGETSDDSIDIETSGRIIRPMLELPNAHLDEFRLNVSGDGLQLQAVDAANVAAIELRAHPEAFDAFDLQADDEFQVGVQLAGLRRELQRARKGKRTDDDVSLSLSQRRTLVTTRREYPETTVTQTGETLNIDPDSVRQEPDLPDLGLACKAEVDVDALQSVIEHVDRVGDHAWIHNDGGNLRVEPGDADGGSHAADFGAVVEATEGNDIEPDARSLFSCDYLTGMLQALNAALVDTVTVVWDEEFPVQLRFSREDDDGTVLYEGHFMLSPRIQP